jgi:hypothetical protein
MFFCFFLMKSIVTFLGRYNLKLLKIIQIFFNINNKLIFLYKIPALSDPQDPDSNFFWEILDLDPYDVNV